MENKISNPLTVVAIFSGLAEAFATVALINVPPEIQSTFVYFVMAFPVLIVLLFFAVLNWNHSVLYAPSDFEDETMYLESMKVRGTLRNAIVGTLTTQVSGNINLTPKQIEEVSENIDKAIDEVSSLPRKQQILLLLNEGPLTSSAISETLELNKSYTYRLLGELLNEGKISQKRLFKYMVWSVRAPLITDNA
ncbi:ArsR family transcriptional regulator [Pseudomonas anguilliseptica]|uniref:ArsR family transcriptional regulator n=1 Tax=Pseudomonas anguilliseptica TaxID=53406 RepID=UPI0022B037DD|nr:ArsR family transcriptional regulator [Pseudomonas anguilliseptica]MCZ4324563.1 ArsR family transcriptional regulator [Pseudomonas anguilliseptica]